MSEWAQLLVFTTLAGAAIPVGGALGLIERLRPYWLEQELRHSIIAVGGGALVAAVALVLVPEGARRLSISIAMTAMTAGGIAMMLMERWLAKRGGHAAQFTAMLLDFLPESVALGALFAHDRASGPLLALLIAAQNLPEGFNALRELQAAGMRHRRILLLFILLVPLGPAFAVAGQIWLASHGTVLGVVMLFASGGILYLIFQDIAPQVRLQRHWGPPLGAVAGFMIGLAGSMAFG